MIRLTPVARALLDIFLLFLLMSAASDFDRFSKRVQGVEELR